MHVKLLISFKKIHYTHPLICPYYWQKMYSARMKNQMQFDSLKYYNTKCNFLKNKNKKCILS